MRTRHWQPKSPEGSKRWANVGQTWDALQREGDGQWGWSLTDEFGVCSRILLEHGSETLKSGLIQFAAVQLWIRQAVDDACHIDRRKVAIVIPLQCGFALSRGLLLRVLNGRLTLHVDTCLSGDSHNSWGMAALQPCIGVDVLSDDMPAHCRSGGHCWRAV